MRSIWKVGKGRRKKLEDALNASKPGDVIFLYPGEYHFIEGFNVKNVEIKGIGNNPGDVVLFGRFVVHNQSSLSLSNVTLHAPHNRNAFNIKGRSTVNLDKVIIHGELSGDYPAIWCEESKLNMHASEVYFSEERDSGVHLSKQSEAEIRYSIVDSLCAYQSSIQLHQTQIRVAITLSDNGMVNGTGMTDFPGVGSLYNIYMEKGSRANFHSVNVDESIVTFSVDQSTLTIKETTVGEYLQIVAHHDKQSTVDIAGDKDKVVVYTDGEEAEQETENVALGAVQAAQPNNADPYLTEHPEDTIEETEPQHSDGSKPGLEELQDLYGLHSLKEQVMKFINTVKFNQSRKEQGFKTTSLTLHSLFMGNPGTGKTTVARILGRVLYETGVIGTDHFIEVTRKDLVGEYIGTTATKTQEILERSRGGILFIDEAYALNSDSENDFGKEAIDTILTFMEDHREDTMIIFAGYTDDMNKFLKMNSGLESRIPNKFYFDDYSPEEIAEIGYMNITNEDYIVDEQKYKQVIQRLYSYSVDQSNARWVRNINEKLIQSMANRVIETGSDDTQTILDEDFDVLTGNQQLDKDEKIQDLLYQLDSLIGLTDVKEYVHRLIKQVKIDRLLAEDGGGTEKPSYHMIFAGNPGTGKTTVANIIAELFYYLDVLPTPNVKTVDRSDLVGGYVGHTEKQTKEVLEQSLGGVLFIDEAYQLTSQASNDFGKQAVETLLTYLENYRDKFIVILAGYTDEMEQFLGANPGLRSRIPLKITFPDYSPDEIATIVEKTMTKNWEVNVPLLRSVVKEVYAKLPITEKANARWARNFTERLISNHKVWLSDHHASAADLKKIHDDVIREEVHRVIV